MKENAKIKQEKVDVEERCFYSFFECYRKGGFNFSQARAIWKSMASDQRLRWSKGLWRSMSSFELNGLEGLLCNTPNGKGIIVEKSCNFRGYLIAIPSDPASSEFISSYSLQNFNLCDPRPRIPVLADLTKKDKGKKQAALPSKEMKSENVRSLDIGLVKPEG